MPRTDSPRRSPLVAIVGALATTALDAALLALALGGISALLAHVRALALLAVWLAGALVLAWLRPVSARAGTRRESDPLLMVALLILPLAAAPLAAWGERAGVWTLPGGAARAAAGVGLAAGGLALRIAAIARLGSRFDPTVAILPDHALETGGLYSRMRHPGYAGALIAALGGALTFDGGVGLVAVALMAVALGARIRREERALETHFGEEYRRYRARTGALLPRVGR